MSDPVDTFTEVTTRSWGSKLGGSLMGMVLGPLLVIGACVGLFWNEGRAVTTARSLTEGASIVVNVPPSPVSPGNEGKLVHVNGDLTARGRLADPDFAVTSNAVRLIRHVEMYQWKEESKSETRKNVGGSEETVTTYTYNREWSGKPIDSSKFKQPGSHENPRMTITDRDIVSRDATLGSFRLGDQAIREFGTGTKLDVDPSVADAVRKNTRRPVNVSDGQIYLSDNPGSPRIGDYRVSYRIVPAGPASMVAQQKGSELSGYQSKAGDVILLAQTGTASAAEMFKAAQDENRIFTWILRAVFALIMFIGFVLAMGLFVAIADVLPFLGNIVQTGTFLIAFLLTAILAPVTIALAWLFYRPLVSLVALVIGGILVYGVLRLMKSRRAAQPAAQPAQPA
jgi:hypothetical protein